MDVKIELTVNLASRRLKKGDELALASSVAVIVSSGCTLRSLVRTVAPVAMLGSEYLTARVLIGLNLSMTSYFGQH